MFAKFVMMISILFNSMLMIGMHWNRLVQLSGFAPSRTELVGLIVLGSTCILTALLGIVAKPAPQISN